MCWPDGWKPARSCMPTPHRQTAGRRPRVPPGTRPPGDGGYCCCGSSLRVSVSWRCLGCVRRPPRMALITGGLMPMWGAVGGVLCAASVGTVG